MKANPSSKRPQSKIPTIRRANYILDLSERVRQLFQRVADLEEQVHALRSTRKARHA